MGNTPGRQEVARVKELGQRLRDERIARGLTLEYVADQTKIARRYLTALEEGEIDRLPGDPYVKGFIRSYAKAIGCDPEPFVAHYKERREMEEAAAEAKPAPKRKPGAFLAKVNQTLQWFGL